VVQLYVRDVTSTAFRPRHELKAFAKVDLAPGESRRVALKLDRRAFATWDTAIADWVVEAGEFELRLGASSRDIRAVLPVTVEAPARNLDPGPAAYHEVASGALPDRASFAQLYGRALPPNAAPRRGQYTVNTPIAQLRHPVARLQRAIMRRAARKAFKDAEGTPAGLLIDSMLQEVTPRMLAMVTGGRLGPAFGRALIQVCNGATLSGLLAMARGLRAPKRP
jgi:beta-glucosidase